MNSSEKPRSSASAARRAAAAQEAAAGLRGRLQLDKDGAPFLGAGRIDLLEAIDRCGSITAAAKAVDLSYKAAWDAVDAMNNQADEALVARVSGGRNGGGTRLTEYGRRVLNLVRAIEGEYQRMLGLLAEDNHDFAEYQRLMRRFSLQTSARNQWVGRIEEVRLGLVEARVRLRLDEQTFLEAAVSSASVDRLGLRPGAEVGALVKAVATRMQAGEPPADVQAGAQVTAQVGAQANPQANPQTHSQTNIWRATVSVVHPGAERAEVTAQLPGGRNVTAFIAAADVTAAIAPGAPVSVFIDPTSVLLVAV